MKTPRHKLTRRIRQLEDCLRFVLMWCHERRVELNAHGADDEECEEYHEMVRLRNRVHRTLPANTIFGLNVRKPPKDL